MHLSLAKNQKIPIIETFNLRKDFRVGRGYKTVLDNISIAIAKEDFTIIYGPSGCGKSTLLHSIAGLEEPTSGSVFVRESNIYELKSNQRARFRAKNFGVVYQSSYWVKSLSALDNVALPLLLLGETESSAYKVAKEYIQKLGLEEFERYIPTELSGGQQQKLSMARALTSDPDIVIADEPTGNLDTKSAAEVIGLLKDLNEKMQKAVIMVTHNMSYLGHATKLISMRDGKVINSSKGEGLPGIVDISEDSVS